MSNTHAHESLKSFSLMLDNHKQREPLYFSFDLQKLNKEILERYRTLFRWQYRDSLRSFTNPDISDLTDRQLSYANRFQEYFGVNQIEACLANPKLVATTWDPKRDLTRTPRPCLLSFRLIQDGKWLHIAVVFRAREMLRRMVGNWYCFMEFQREICEKRDLKPGKIYDFSMEAWFQKSDRINWEKEGR